MAGLCRRSIHPRPVVILSDRWHAIKIRNRAVCISSMGSGKSGTFGTVRDTRSNGQEGLTDDHPATISQAV